MASPARWLRLPSTCTAPSSAMHSTSEANQERLPSAAAHAGALSDGSWQSSRSTVSISPAGQSRSALKYRMLTRKIVAGFVVADDARKSMCRCYWEEGDIGTPVDTQYQLQVLDANADDVAPPASGKRSSESKAAASCPWSWTRSRRSTSTALAQVRTKASDGQQWCVHRVCSRRRHRRGRRGPRRARSTRGNTCSAAGRY